MADRRTGKPTVTLDDIRAVVAVANAGSIRAAAGNRATANSRLSKQVSRVENRVGVSLFQRLPHGMEPTAAGNTFVRRARRVIAQVDAMLEQAARSGRAETGQLCLGFCTSLSAGRFALALQVWREANPDVSVDLENASPQDNLQELVVGHLDVAVVPGHPTLRGYKTLPLWPERIFAVVRQDHRLADRASVSLEDISRERFVVSRHAPGPETHDWIIRHLSEPGSPPTIDTHGVTRDTLLSMVQLGYGMTLVSEAEVGLAPIGIRFVPVDTELVPFSAVYSPTRDNPVLRAFISFLRVQVRETPPSAPSD